MRIDIPDYDTFVDFPDGMPQGEIEKVLANQFPKKPTIKDRVIREAKQIAKPVTDYPETFKETFYGMGGEMYEAYKDPSLSNIVEGALAVPGMVLSPLIAAGKTFVRDPQKELAKETYRLTSGSQNVPESVEKVGDITGHITELALAGLPIESAISKLIPTPKGLGISKELGVKQKQLDAMIDEATRTGGVPALERKLLPGVERKALPVGQGFDVVGQPYSKIETGLPKITHEERKLLTTKVPLTKKAYTPYEEVIIKPLDKGLLNKIEPVFGEEKLQAALNTPPFLRTAEDRTLIKLMQAGRKGLKGVADPISNEAGFLSFGKDKYFNAGKESWAKKQVDGIEMFLSTMDIRLGNIATPLRMRVKRHFFDVSKNVNRDLEKIDEFYKKVNALDERVQAKLTQLTHNQDFQGARQVMRDNGIDPVLFDKATGLVDDLANRGIQSGMRIQKDIPKYFPSRVRNYEGLKEHLHKTGRGEASNLIDDAIKQLEKEYPNLTAQEKGAIIDKFIRGFPQGKVLLTDPRYAKARTLKHITVDDAKYYTPLHEELKHYILDMNKRIADNRLFGKGNQPTRREMKWVRDFFGKEFDESFDYSDILKTEEGIDASIGNLINRIKTEGYVINNDQARQIRSMLRSYLYPKKVNTWVKLGKEATYTALLSDISTALTQLQSEGLTVASQVLGKPQGWRNYFRAWGDVITRRGLKLKDVGVDSLRADFERQGIRNIITKTALQPLRLTDVANKEALLNTIQRRFQGLAQKKNPEFMKDLKMMYGDKADVVRKQIAKGEKTDDALFAMYFETSKFHPLSSLDVPQKYLDSSTWNMLMTLHTYQLKQVHVFREMAYNEIKKGNVKTGVSNLIKLTASLIATGMPINYIQDYVRGKEIDDVKGYFMDSALQTIGMNKYMYDKMSGGGFRKFYTGVKNYVEPAIFNIAYNVVDDLFNEFGTAADKAKPKRSIQYTPFIGREIYNRMEKVEDKHAYYKKKDIKSQIQGKSDKEIDTILRKALKAGDIKPKDADNMWETRHVTGLQRQLDRANLKEALWIWDEASDEEKKEIYEKLMKKADNFDKKGKVTHEQHIKLMQIKREVRGGK